MMRVTVLLALIVCGMAVPSASGDEADQLYARRTDLASARHAIDIWTALLQTHPADYDASWKIARADYWVGRHVAENEQLDVLEAGVAHGRRAAALAPTRPEGHFWLAANMGAAAELSQRAGLRYRKAIKEELETVLRLDPAFLQGSADRALGRWYFKVPRLFGGSRQLAESHLRKSLTYNPGSTASHFFLAELLIDDGRTAEARAELQQVLAAPPNPGWGPEDDEFKQKARRALDAMKEEQ